MTALEGTLNDMSMVNLVQVLTISKKSGILALLNDSVKGTLFVERGQVVYAAILLTLTNEVLLQGDEAFYTAMHWPAARFRFTPKAPTLPEYPASMTTDIRVLIMEGLRRLDEAGRPSTTVGVDSWVRLGPGWAPHREHHDLTGHILLLVRRNIRRVSELAEQSGLGKLLTLMTVADLVDHGLLCLEPPPPARNPVRPVRLAAVAAR
ncbi:MAG TPA: DUF4388 domain-containing protein [Chloroflexia bacterium]|nr:DUF4388 domain-containing protein [Chloroflexia bacterium]